MKNNGKQTYWFKRRRYGFGWTPVTWQGWLVIVLFLGIILANAWFVVITPYSNELLWLYLNILITAVAALLIIAHVKGPVPKWRWGKKPSDKKDEDF